MKHTPLILAAWVAAAPFGNLHAAPPTPQRVLELCAQAEGPAHCGRLVEAEQLKTLPNLAVRDGDTLRVTMFPAGVREFVDVSSPDNARSFALWDYWSPLNSVVMFTTDGSRLGYAMLQRATGHLTMLPAEPVLAPDRQRIAIADFCSAQCDNEVTVWRVTRDGIRKELAWKPQGAWTDVNVTWNEGGAIDIRYTVDGESAPRSIGRKLTDPAWQRF